MNSEAIHFPILIVEKGVATLGGFEQLDVWKKAKALTGEIGRIVRKLPQNEQFELSSQMRRASVSISSNISEGYGRGSRKDYINFLNIARGSNCELQTQMLLCVEHGYVLKSDIKRARALSFDVGRMLNRLIAALKED